MMNQFQKNVKSFFITLLGFLIFACSSQEYTTAKLAIQQSEWAKAEEYLPKAIAVEPDNPAIPIVYAIAIHARNKNWEEMRLLLEKSLSIDPNKMVEVNSGGTHFAKDGPYNFYISVQDHFDNIINYYWSTQFNKGIEKINLSQKKQDDSNDKKQYLNDAIEFFINASIINPDDPQAYAALSNCYLDLDDKDSAIKFIKTAVEKDPEGFKSNFSAGQILLKCGMNNEVVLPYYEKAVEVEPSNSSALRALASTYYELGNKENSIKVFKNAIKIEKDNKNKADLFYNLGVIHNQMGNYEDAEKAFDEAYYLNEEDYGAVLGMAEVFEQLGNKYYFGSDGFTKDFNLAVRWYRKAEKKIKDAKSMDLDNEAEYQRQLDLIRYKRNIAEQNMLEKN